MAEVVEGTQWTGHRGGGGTERSLTIGRKKMMKLLKYNLTVICLI